MHHVINQIVHCCGLIFSDVLGDVVDVFLDVVNDLDVDVRLPDIEDVWVPVIGILVLRGSPDVGQHLPRRHFPIVFVLIGCTPHLVAHPARVKEPAVFCGAYVVPTFPTLIARGGVFVVLVLLHLGANVRRDLNSTNPLADLWHPSTIHALLELEYTIPVIGSQRRRFSGLEFYEPNREIFSLYPQEQVAVRASPELKLDSPKHIFQWANDLRLL